MVLILTARISLKNQNRNQNFKKNIAERKKLRKQTLNEIAKKEKMISPELFKRYCRYLSPSSVCKGLNEPKSFEENKGQVNTLENKLTNLIKIPTKNQEKNQKRKYHAGNCRTYSLL